MTAPLLVLSGITKWYGTTRALGDVDFGLRQGEVHALVGENGAGKSTLLAILAGVVAPDRGEIAISGQLVTIGNPSEAQAFGISTVFQELSLAGALTVAENVFVGRAPTTCGIIRWGELRRRTRQILSAFGIDINVGSPVDRLPQGKRQLVEIAKALSLDARILLLDEPTSALTRDEVAALFAMLERLKTRGIGIVYVSHQMGEVFRIADRVTVLRDGKRITTRVVAETSIDDVVRAMVGRELGTFTAETAPVPGPVALATRCGGAKGKSGHLELEIRFGEVVGLAGLMGSRRSELARSLVGLRQPPKGVAIEIGGRPTRLRSLRDAMSRGIAYVPDDRKTEGLFLSMSIVENFVVTRLRRFSRLGWIERGMARDATIKAVERFRVRVPSLTAAAGKLSGGNQQKLMLSKWLAADPAIVVIDEPTRGVDVEAKLEIHQEIRHRAAVGKAILVISSDLPELLAISDRIVVMREGQIVGNLPTAAATEEVVMALASGTTGQIMEGEAA
jgi:ribose transport system ATP-binding protein